VNVGAVLNEKDKALRKSMNWMRGTNIHEELVV
jgi:hypothetical protein